MASLPNNYSIPNDPNFYGNTIVSFQEEKGVKSLFSIFKEKIEASFSTNSEEKELALKLTFKFLEREFNINKSVLQPRKVNALKFSALLCKVFEIAIEQGIINKKNNFIEIMYSNDQVSTIEKVKLNGRIIEVETLENECVLKLKI